MNFMLNQHCRDIVIAPGEPGAWQQVRGVMMAKGRLTGLLVWTIVRQKVDF